MKYNDRLLSLIASKTSLDPQELAKEVVTRFFETVDDEGRAFINDCLKWQNEPHVFVAVVMSRITEKVEEVVNDEESLCLDETASELRARHDRVEAAEFNREMREGR